MAILIPFSKRKLSAWQAVQDRAFATATSNHTPAATLDHLCLRFGVWKTSYALFRDAWRHRQTMNRITDLPNSLRRDVGLPENEVCFSEARFTPWDIRL